MSIEKLSTNASLKDVMDKFEEISFQDFSNIDIVVKSELPADVKENMVVIISDISPAKIIADTKPIDDVDINDNEFYIKLSTNSNQFAENKYLASKNITVNVYLEKVYVKSNSVITLCDNIYIGSNNSWVKILDSKLDIFADGKYIDDKYSISRSAISGGSTPGSCYASVITDQNSQYKNTICISYSTYSNTTAEGGILYDSAEKIDLTKFSKLVFLIKHSPNSSGMRFSVGNTRGAFSFASSTILKKSGQNIEVVVDVSKINEEMYIKIDTYFSGLLIDKLYIESIYLTV